MAQKKSDVLETLASAGMKNASADNAQNNIKNNDTAALAQKAVSQEEVLELMRQFNMADDDNILNPKVQARQTEEQAKIAAARSKIQRELSYASENISRSAVNKLISSGLALEKISLNVLNSVIREIEQNPGREFLNNNSKEMAEKLSGAEMSDASIAVLVKSGKQLSAENIYVAKFSAGNAESKLSFDEEAWEKLEPSVDKIFREQGIEKTDENIKAAKLLFANRIPITKQNIDKTSFLKNLSKNLDMLKKNDRLIDAVGKIKGEAVDIALKKQLPPTLKNLIAENAKSSEGVEILSAESVTAKRQLAEIQLKLTKESAYRLAESGIEIDTLPLENALEQLRKIESEGYAKSLRIMDVPETPQNVEKMSGIFNAVSSFKTLSNSVYGDLMLKKAEFTIDGIENSFKLSKTLADLELFATAANPKYGDSFKKVRQQIAPLLDELGIPPTDDNIKAAAILSKNKIDVNEESIKVVSAIEGKISRIFNTLHPNIAAKMIKDGLDPKYMHIDDVQEYIDTFNGKFGEDLGDKISRYILEMDKKDFFAQTDEKTRESMMNIYKMLNRIQKNETAAVGVLYKNGIDLTLDKLLQASGYYSKTQGNRGMVDISVDRTVGELVNFEYNSQRVRDFSENAVPRSLSSLIAEQDDLFEQNLDEVIGSLKAINTEAQKDGRMSEEKERMMQKFNETVQSLAKSPVEIISALRENGIDLTVGNIINEKNRLKNGPKATMNRIERITEHENDGKRALQIKKIQDYNRRWTSENKR